MLQSVQLASARRPPASVMRTCVDYIEMHIIVIAHRGFTNVVTNFLRVSDNKVVYGAELSKNGRMWTMGLEHKGVVFMKDFVGKYSKPGQLFLTIPGNVFNSEGMPIST